MEALLKTIVEELVEEGAEVNIEKVIKDGRGVYQVTLPKNQFGRVIGRKGRIASSIRTIIRSLGAKEGQKVDIEFIEK